MSILIKHIEIEEFMKSNDSIPHFVGNEVFEVTGWVIPPLHKEQVIVKEEIINRLKELMEAIVDIIEQDEG